MLTLGLDWSMTCPALAVYSGDKENFGFDKCFLYYLSERKPIQWQNITGRKAVDSTNNEERWNAIAEWMAERVNYHRVDNEPIKAYCEDYSFGSKGRSFHIAENMAITKHFLWKMGAKVVPVSPSVIKKFGSGKGNALKEHMFAAFLQETGHNLMSIFQPKATNVGSPVGDIVDAYYICKFGIMVGGEGNLEPRKKAAK